MKFRLQVKYELHVMHDMEFHSLHNVKIHLKCRLQVKYELHVMHNMEFHLLHNVKIHLKCNMELATLCLKKEVEVSIMML